MAKALFFYRCRIAIRVILNAISCDMNKKDSNWYWFLDYMIIPLLLIFVVFQRNFIHGFINYLEAGKELACVNELFHGKMLYRDIFTLVGPLNIYLEAFFMLVFGKSLAVLRGYFYFGTIITLIIGYFIARSLCRLRFFAYITALMLIVETYHPFWATRWGGIRFGFGLVSILCAINFLKKEKGIWAFFSGIFTAVAFLTSMDIGILASVAISFTFCSYIVFNFIKNKKFKLKSLILFFVGIVVILIPFIFYFVMEGALLPYVNTLIVIAENHTKVWGQVGIGRIFEYNFKYIFPIILYACSTIYLIHRISKKTIYWRDYGVLCLSIYGLLMYKMAFRAIHGPQFAMSLQPAIILVFVFMEDMFKQIVKIKQKTTVNKGNFVKLIAAVIIFIFTLSYVVFSEKRFYGNFKGWFLYQKYKAYLMPMYMGVIPLSELRLSALAIEGAKGIVVPESQAREIEGVTRYIVSVTRQDEPIFSFPEHGIYNFFTNRPVVSRFPIAGFAWTAEEYKTELLKSLKECRPRYVIFGTWLSNLAISIGRKEELLPEVSNFIKENYIVEKRFATIDIYRLKRQ